MLYCEYGDVIMKKWIIGLLAVCMLTGCGSQREKIIKSSTGKIDTTPVPTETPEVQKEEIHDFDPLHNQVVTFGEYTIEVPADWQKNDNGVWCGMRDGENWIAAVTMFKEIEDGETGEEFLKEDPFIFENLFDDSPHTIEWENTGTVNDILVRRAQITSGEEENEGTFYIQAFLTGDSSQIAYIILFEPADTPYDYSEDIQDIMESLKMDTATTEQSRLEQQRMQDIRNRLDNAEVVFETDQLEYADKTLDPLKMISCSDPDITITAQTKINLRKIDKQTVIYVLELEGEQRKITQTYEVADTKEPVIKLKKKNITLDYGTDYDPASNIESVSDPVDGDLTFVESEDEAKICTYYIEGSYDPKRAGSYEFSVHAMDANTNVSTKKFTIQVEPEPYAEPTYTYIANKNTRKFHYPDCRSVSRMKNSNKWEVTTTRQWMIDNGYTPCGNCHP